MKYYSGLVISFLFSAVFLLQCGKDTDRLNETAVDNGNELVVELASFENAVIKDVRDLDLEEISSENANVSFAGAEWDVRSDIKEIENQEDAYIVKITAKVTSGTAGNVSIGFKINIPEWSDENYVLMPGAAYAGNRFRGIKKISGKSFAEVYEMIPGEGPLLSNVPRLNVKGESSLQQLSGDMSTPAVAWRSAGKDKGVIIVSDQGTGHGYYSYKVWENENHDSATVTMRIPGVREDSVYRGGSNYFYPSTDKGADLKTGDELYLECKVYYFDAPDVQSVFDKFAGLRKEYGDQSIPNEMPYSYGWKLQEKKYNLQNWVNKYGYYSVGMRESTYQDWQTGWTGGMNAVYPLLVNGSDSTYQRALRTFDFLFDTISPSGFFYDVFYDGEWMNTDRSTLLRRNSDALYFILRSYEYIREKDPEFEIPLKWEEATKGCADAFVNLWDKYGEFGQWIDFNSGKITAPGTASNSIVCGALAMCSEYFENERYLEVAEAAAEDYYRDYVTKGYTNGGPGDAYQNTDSESAFGLLESFIVLYELTNDEKWLTYAEELGIQIATWVVSFNFDFPSQSTFAKMGMKTTGTVIANVQNKHAAPGICSLSGNSLLKLYRYSGNPFYLELIKDITKSMPQYMSREDRPIPDVRPDMPWPEMPPGWINERVNMSDWEERGRPDNIRRGEIFGGSTWSEVAFMNAYADIPGIYIVKDKGEVTVMDNVEAKMLDKDILEISNPTKFPAEVKIFIENSEDQKKILAPDYMRKCQIVKVAAGAKKKVKI